MEQSQIREKLLDGYIHIRAIIEVMGKPKEYVEESLQGHLNNIKDDKELLIAKQHIEPASEQEGFFSTFAELEILAKNNAAVLAFCFDYMPSSVEILHPEDIVLKNTDLSHFLNDLQARQHSLNTAMLKFKESNSFYIKNTAILMRNFIVVMLRQNTLTIEEMLPYLGIKKEDALKVVDVLVKEGKIKKDGDAYTAQ